MSADAVLAALQAHPDWPQGGEIKKAEEILIDAIAERQSFDEWLNDIAKGHRAQAEVHARLGSRMLYRVHCQMAEQIEYYLARVGFYGDEAKRAQGALPSRVTITFPEDR